MYFKRRYEDIDQLHEIYIRHIKELVEKYKRIYTDVPDAELEIIWSPSLCFKNGCASTEAHSELCQKSKKECFAKIVHLRCLT